MSPTQPFKRRRLDKTSNALSKPFKSPFKTPLKAKPDTETNAATLSSPVKDGYTAMSSALVSSPQESPSPPTAPRNRGKVHTSETTASAELLALQKTHTHLLNQFTAVRASLETSNQALKIELSDRDTELEALIVKWKVASRAAAEEVFAGARDKVNKMGGVGAMRDREKQKSDMAWGWDEPKKSNEEEDVGNKEDEDGFRIGEIEGEEQDEREEGAKKADIIGDDDDGYTIDMMLKTLNIELDLIGYDKDVQKWVD
ncbi:Swi5-dependent recombination DNA repair protein 1, partial [Lecanoromycetidae sp. Uapishka_2]